MEKMMKETVRLHINISHTANDRNFARDYEYPLSTDITTTTVFDTGCSWHPLLEKCCEAISAYYGYDIKDKVIIKQFGEEVNIAEHREYIYSYADKFELNNSQEADSENPST
jgi:hypothetical protein